MKHIMIRMTGSLGFKLGANILLLVSLTGLAIIVGLNAFSRVGAEMRELAETDVPLLDQHSEIVAASTELRSETFGIVLARNTSDLETAAKRTQETLNGLNGQIAGLTGPARAPLEEALIEVAAQVPDLVTLRTQEFALAGELDTYLADLGALTMRAQANLTGESGLSYAGAIAAVEQRAARRPTPFAPPQLAAPSGDTATRHIDRMQQTTILSEALSDIYIHGVEAVRAVDEAALAEAEVNLGDALAKIARITFDGDAALREALAALPRFVDAETGLVARRRAQLDLRAEAAMQAAWVVSGVTEIAQSAHDLADETLLLVHEEADLLNADMQRDEAVMRTLAWAAAVLALGSAAAIWLVVMRPLGRIVDVTGQLADGHMGATDALRSYGGELGELVSALRIFDKNIADKRLLEEEEARAREERDAAARREAEATRQREQREREQEAALAERERARAAEEAQREQARRAAADEERRERAAAQNAVVSALAQALRRLADGDLSVQIENRFEDSYEQLRVDFNAAARTLGTALGEIRTIAGTIFDSSSSVSRAAEDLSRRTEHTAATLEESAAALQELTAAVRSATSGAEEADRIVIDARKSAEASDAVVRDAIQAMGGISESSNSISRIVDVIDDIAFQTNLLALNAGVEAARAGEAGRGFAVVASEVRALSQRSSEAAGEIGALISESALQVGKGVDLVNQVGTALSGIVTSIVKISSNVSEIAASSRDQASGIGEINVAVSQLDQVTQQNASMVEETTAASVDLTREVESLTAILAQFTLAETPLEAQSDIDLTPAEDAA